MHGVSGACMECCAAFLKDITMATVLWMVNIVNGICWMLCMFDPLCGAYKHKTEIMGNKYCIDGMIDLFTVILICFSNVGDMNLVE